MTNTSFEDRRIFARFPVSFPLRILDLNSNKEILGQTQDISAKGIGLVTNEKLNPRTELELWLQIPDHAKPLYARGEVVWFNMGSPGKCRAGVNLEKADLMGLSRVLRVAQA